MMIMRWWGGRGRGRERRGRGGGGGREGTRYLKAAIQHGSDITGVWLKSNNTTGLSMHRIIH